MTGHRPFSELTKDFTSERRARVAARAAELREEMTLDELRKARSLSQEEVATTLDVGQPAVAKLEKRADMHVSNLRRYVEALGGTLEITALFPDATVVLPNIGGVADAGSEAVTSELSAALTVRKSKQLGPRKSSVEKMIALGLDPRVLAGYRASGYGWQRRLNEVLKAGLVGFKGYTSTGKALAAKKAKAHRMAVRKAATKKRT
jgi:uncharacterized protein (DUF4415 family)/predicted XRE-type DNA-binding protein